MSVIKNVTSVLEESNFPVIEERDPMVEKYSWSYTPDDIFPDSKGLGNCFKGNFTDPVDKVFSEDRGILDDRDAETNSGMYRYPLSDIYPTNGDVSIFGNEDENQECSYLSYEGGWPDMSCIEDLDGLFRNCDSSFGHEIVHNNKEMSWFPSSIHASKDSEDVSVPGLKAFNSCSSALESTKKHCEIDVQNTPCLVTPASDENNVPSYSSLCHSSYGDCLDANAESISGPTSEKQAFKDNGGIRGEVFPSINSGNDYTEMHNTLKRKQMKNHLQIEAKRKDASSEYSFEGSFLIPSTPQQLANPTKRSSDSTPNNMAVKPEKNMEKHHWEHHLQALSSNTYQQDDLVNQAAFTEQVHILKQLQETRDGVQGHCGVEKVSTEPPYLDTNSSIVLDSSRMSSVGSDKTSVEEASFQQLQSVMEQLDVRTKLCIRDSLYRLARSAEQRNNMGHLEGNCRDQRDQYGVMTTEESKKCTRFMDVETDTNPIDRSVAHLLFHRPSEGTSFESHASTSFHTFNNDPNFMI